MKENKKIIEKAMQYINEHLDERVSLQQVSSAAGYSKSHLNRMFAESTGKTIYKYIREKRLNRAAKRLVNTDQSIVEIALEAGYDSQQAFTLAFRKQYGMTPLVYRERETENIIVYQSWRAAA